jgi:hypothetical protein
MTISAIGAVGTGLAPLAGLGGISTSGGIVASTLTGSSGSAEALMQLIQLINDSSLAPSAKVAISDAAESLIANDSGADTASMGELSQALIVALMLQLLEGLPSH